MSGAVRGWDRDLATQESHARMWPKETLLRGPEELPTKGHSSAAPNGDPGNNLPNPGEKKVYKRRHIHAME